MPYLISKRLNRLTLMAACTLLAFSGHADVTYEFIQGEDCDCFHDTTIFSESQYSGGGTNAIYSGTNAEMNTRRALLRVDLSRIPADAVVTEVRLEMTVDRSGDNFGDMDYALHRVTQAWGEGGAEGIFSGGFGAPASTGDATWTHANLDEQLWVAPGGDFSPTPSATASAGRARTTTVWAGAGLVADVRQWITDPARNHGWIIISALEGQTKRVKRFDSSEAGRTRPRLLVTVESEDNVTPPEPEDTYLLQRLWFAIQDFLARLFGWFQGLLT